MLDMVLWVLLPFAMFMIGWFLGVRERKAYDQGILLVGDDVNGKPYWTLDIHLPLEEVAKKKHIQLRVMERN